MTINWSNVTTPIQVLAGANDNSGGWFWTTGWFMFIIVLFMAMLGFGAEASLLVSCFIALISGVLLLYLGLIPLYILAIPLGIMLSLMIYKVYSSGSR